MVGLGDEQLVDVHADPLRVRRVHGVLRVDERADPALLLGVGEDVVEQRRLTGRLRPEHLDDAPARHAADAERQVQRQRARRDRGDLHLRGVVPHLHDRARPEGPLDLRERTLEGCLARLGGLLLLLLHSCDLLEVLRSQRRSAVGWILAPRTPRRSERPEAHDSPLRGLEAAVAVLRAHAAPDRPGASSGSPAGGPRSPRGSPTCRWPGSPPRAPRAARSGPRRCSRSRRTTEGSS